METNMNILKLIILTTKKPVTIICPIHGEFRQSASHHLYSATRCPRCIESEIESTIRWFLNENNINFEQYKSFKWLNRQVKNDIIKRQLCENNNIKMLYYSNLGIDYPYQVYEDLEELLKEIKK